MHDEHEASTGRVIGLAKAVHRILGPGLQERVYESALHYELESAGIESRRQVPIEVIYRGTRMGVGFRVDLLVERNLPIELKAVERLTDLHKAQLLSYLNLLRLKRGLLPNFNATPLRNGIRRVAR